MQSVDKTGYDTLRELHSDIIRAPFDRMGVAAELFSKGIIGENLIDVKCTENENKSMILNAVRASGHPDAFQVLVSVLGKEKQNSYICQLLTTTYEKNLKLNPLVNHPNDDIYTTKRHTCRRTCRLRFLVAIVTVTVIVLLLLLLKSEPSATEVLVTDHGLYRCSMNMTAKDVIKFAQYLQKDELELKKLKEQYLKPSDQGFQLLEMWKDAAHQSATYSNLYGILQIEECGVDIRLHSFEASRSIVNEAGIHYCSSHMTKDDINFFALSLKKDSEYMNSLIVRYPDQIDQAKHLLRQRKDASHEAATYDILSKLLENADCGHDHV